MIINLQNADSVEIIEGDIKTKCNLKITMASGRVYNNYYDDAEQAKDHYFKIKSGMQLYLENK